MLFIRGMSFWRVMNFFWVMNFKHSNEFRWTNVLRVISFYHILKFYQSDENSWKWWINYAKISPFQSFITWIDELFHSHKWWTFIISSWQWIFIWAKNSHQKNEFPLEGWISFLHTLTLWVRRAASSYSSYLIIRSTIHEAFTQKLMINSFRMKLNDVN